MFNDNEIISSYTRKEAIADKQQFNVDDYDINIRRDTGIKIPVYITDNIMTIVETSAKVSNDSISWILFDICNMCAVFARHNRATSNFKFPVAIKYINKAKQLDIRDHYFYSEIGANDIDDPNPVITIMSNMDL